jgi:hypothetical protein
MAQQFAIKNPVGKTGFEILFNQKNKGLFGIVGRRWLVAGGRGSRLWFGGLLGAGSSTGVGPVDIGFGFGSTTHKQYTHQAKQANNACKKPGAFFEHIGGLLYTHKLVAKAGYIAGKATTFRVLNQNDEAQNYAGQYD